jgi:hypothetical protein
MSAEERSLLHFLPLSQFGITVKHPTVIAIAQFSNRIKSRGSRG